MNMPPFWAMYVAVPKLEEAVAHIKRLGGSELSPIIEVPTVGRMQRTSMPPRNVSRRTAAKFSMVRWRFLMATGS
jgi:predicted enzyme related to lactoylglutathione lyase